MDELAYATGVDPVELRLRTTPTPIRIVAADSPRAPCANASQRERHASVGGSVPFSLLAAMRRISQPPMRDGKFSIWLAEYEREGHHEDLDANVIADVQDPIPAIRCAVRHDEGPHNSCSVVTRLNEIVYSGAILINQYPLVTGAMEIDVGHILPPSIAFRHEV